MQQMSDFTRLGRPRHHNGLGAAALSWASQQSSTLRRKAGLPLPVFRRTPHVFERVGRRIAHPARNRLVVEALHVLLRRTAESRGSAAKQGEFTSRDVGADLLDDPVMINQASDIQRLSDGFGK
jgi:hypothetical protein